MYRILSSRWFVALLILGIVINVGMYIALRPKEKFKEKFLLIMTAFFGLLLLSTIAWQDSFKTHFMARVSSTKYVVVRKEPVVAYRGMKMDIDGEVPTDKIDNNIDYILVKTASGKKYRIENNDSPKENIRIQNQVGKNGAPKYQMTLVKTIPREQYKGCYGARSSSILEVTHNIPGVKLTK